MEISRGHAYANLYGDELNWLCDCADRLSAAVQERDHEASLRQELLAAFIDVEARVEAAEQALEKPTRAWFEAARSAEARLEAAESIIEAARSLHAGLTCEHDPMDVDERIERLGAALAGREPQ